MKRVVLFVLCISSISLVFPQGRTPIEDELYGYVLGIEGSDNHRRGEFIQDQLKRMGVGFVTALFHEKQIHQNDTILIDGENIIARIGHGDKKFIVGAHYDVVEGSPGANDNGSGVAVALGLLNHLKDEGLHNMVEVCFFDQEEHECLGSIWYIKKFVIQKKFLAMINLDVEGTGEELYIGPTESGYDQKIIPIVHKAELQTNFPNFESAFYPASDYSSFASIHVENISISVVPKGDGKKLSDYVENGYKADSLNFPRVLTVMHTPSDRSIYVSPTALKMAFDFSKTLLLLLDAKSEDYFLPPNAKSR